MNVNVEEVIQDESRSKICKLMLIIILPLLLALIIIDVKWFGMVMLHKMSVHSLMIV